MNYQIKETVLSEEEFSELYLILGEHRRVCREQISSEKLTTRYKLVENLIYKLITDVAIKNNNTK